MKKENVELLPKFIFVFFNVLIVLFIFIYPASLLPFPPIAHFNDVNNILRPLQAFLSGVHHSLYTHFDTLRYFGPYLVGFLPLALLPLSIADMIVAFLMLFIFDEFLLLLHKYQQISLWRLNAVFLFLPVAQMFYLDHLMSLIGLVFLVLGYIFYQKDKWYIAGILFAIASMRAGNVIPLVPVFLFFHWKEVRNIFKLLLGAMTFFVPTTICITLLDSHWLFEYLHRLNVYATTSEPSGLLDLAAHFGKIGIISWELVVIALIFVVIHYFKIKKISWGFFTFLLCISFFTAPQPTIYPAIFAIPLLLEISKEQPKEAIFLILLPALVFLLNIIIPGFNFNGIVIQPIVSFVCFAAIALFLKINYVNKNNKLQLSS